MADEQTPQSDLIDDAIRQAERQLEEKLEALRMSALGEPSPAETAPADDVAVLRPTGGSRAHSREDGSGTDASEGPQAPAMPATDPVAWHESEGDDLMFTPAEGSVTLTGNELYVPDAEDEPSFDEMPHELQPHDEPSEQASPTRETLSTSVTDLTPVWEDTSGAQHDFRPTVEPTTPKPSPAPAPTSRDENRWEQPESSWAQPEPVHATWTGGGRPTAASPEPTHDTARPVQPSEDELQFWAQTRTALRTLHQLTSGIPGQVSVDVTTEVQRIVHEELAPTDQTLRSVQAQLQQNLPRMHDRLEGVIEQAAIAPTQGIKQLRDELPAQLNQQTRDLRDAVREDLDHTATTVHGAVQKDVAQLEQSIATNVTRMAHGTLDAVSRAERNINALGEGVVRFERGMHGEFERVEQQLQSAIQRVEVQLREELMEPAETVRKLDDELPARFNRVERTVLEQVQTTQRELSTVLMGLVEANRASLDRIASLASTMDEERARRTEDVEVVVDTVTTGWEGLAGAVKALFEQAEENSRRIAGIEQRLGQIRDLEGAVESTLGDLREFIRDLQPAPVVVTVAHPEAEVQNNARGGWLPESRK
jgi:hypothetical protein